MTQQRWESMTLSVRRKAVREFDNLPYLIAPSVVVPLAIAPDLVDPVLLIGRLSVLVGIHSLGGLSWLKWIETGSCWGAEESHLESG